MKEKPLTKTQRRNVRENTYRIVNKQICATCKHYWNRHGQSQCHAVEFRGKIESLSVLPIGTCDLWEKETNHARTDIPDLVAEVRRLRQQLRKETK